MTYSQTINHEEKTHSISYYAYDATGERYRWLGETESVTEEGYAAQNSRYGSRGVTLYLTGSMNLGYTGKPYDSATGLYNYGYRDYKPQAARFTTPDPIRDGNNWFSYVNNDPVNFIDLWGLKLVPSPDATEEQRRNYDKAIEHLRKNSPVANDLINRLDGSEETVTVEFNNTHTNEYGHDNNTVYWDPTSGLKTGQGGIQTPALGLAHELGHADQDITHNFNRDNVPLVWLEGKNLVDTETPIANDLGEPTRRDYLDVDENNPNVRVKDSLSNKELKQK